MQVFRKIQQLPFRTLVHAFQHMGQVSAQGAVPCSFSNVRHPENKSFLEIEPTHNTLGRLQVGTMPCCHLVPTAWLLKNTGQHLYDAAPPRWGLASQGDIGKEERIFCDTRR